MPKPSRPEAAPTPAIFPAKLQLAFDRTEILRYGENSRTSKPPSTATPPALPGSIAAYTQLQGKELSYNNIADADAAWECVKAFDAPACVIIKHANPCGVAIDGTLLGLRKGLQDRFDLRFRRHHRLQRRSRPRRGQRHERAQALRRSADRPVLHRRSQGRAGPRPTCACWSCRSADLNKLELKRVGGGLLVQTADDFTAGQLPA